MELAIIERTEAEAVAATKANAERYRKGVTVYDPELKRDTVRRIVQAAKILDWHVNRLADKVKYYPLDNTLVVTGKTTLTYAERKGRTRRKAVKPEIELDYTGLTGDWLDWLDTANAFEKRIPLQDRPDYRHDTLIELHRTRQSYGKPLDKLLQYKVASRQVAQYWKAEGHKVTKVCLLSGIAKAQNWQTCTFTHKPGGGCTDCPFRGIRPAESLNRQIADSEGRTIELGELIASDKLEDMPSQWYDLNTWLNGFPTRLIEIAHKRIDGIPIDVSDRNYLARYWKTHQKKLF